MKNELTPFDRLVQKRLQDLEAPYQENHWAQLEEQLADETAAEKFDRTAADRLRPMEAPYNAGHWDLMAQKIDYAFSFRHWLHRYHVPELAIMILFAFTLIQYQLRDSQPASFAPPPKAQPPTSGGKQAATHVAPADRPDELEAIEALVALDEVAINEAPPINANVVQEDIGAAAVESFVGMDAVASLAAIGLGRIEETAPVVFPDIVAMTATPPSDFKALLPKRSRWYVGAYGGLDYNVISAPTDRMFQLPGYLTDSTGYRAGALVAVQKGKWGLQSGLAYAKVAYHPLLPEQQYGTFDYLVVESFNLISYDFLQIPLQVRRGFLSEKSNWDVYAMGGVEANFILNARYDIDKQEIISSRSSETVSPEEIAEKSILGKKRYPEGILNGDSFFQNTYLSFSIGVGLERTLFSRYAFFAEPLYSRPIFGAEIGPNKDRIHQFTVRAGVKIKL